MCFLALNMKSEVRKTIFFVLAGFPYEECRYVCLSAMLTAVAPMWLSSSVCIAPGSLSLFTLFLKLLVRRKEAVTEKYTKMLFSPWKEGGKFVDWITDSFRLEETFKFIEFNHRALPLVAPVSFNESHLAPQTFVFPSGAAGHWPFPLGLWGFPFAPHPYFLAQGPWYSNNCSCY